MRLAIIGGTGVYDPKMLGNIREEKVATPYGEVGLRVGRYQSEEVAFLTRHGEDHSVPPHRVNYRANIWALKKLGVERVLATAAVGSLNPTMQLGDFVFVDQFLDFTRARPLTFFEGGETGLYHTDFTEPYCPQMRSAMTVVAAEMALPSHPDGVYVCTEGPRFETPAEIRAFARLGGDVVGMTSVPEVVLAHEAGLCYATIALVTNMAAGLSQTVLVGEEHRAVMLEAGEKLKSFLLNVLQRLPVERRCNCLATAGPLRV